jgi:hypothetical protein
MSEEPAKIPACLSSMSSHFMNIDEHSIDVEFDVKYETDSLFDDLTAPTSFSLYEAATEIIKEESSTMEDMERVQVLDQVADVIPSIKSRANSGLRPLPIVFPSFEAMLNEYQKFRTDSNALIPDNNSTAFYQPESWITSSTSTPSTSQNSTPRTAIEYESIDSIESTTPRDLSATSITPRSLTPRTPRERDRNSRNSSPRTPRTSSPRTPSGSFNNVYSRPRSAYMITQSLDLLNLDRNSPIPTQPAPSRPKSIGVTNQPRRAQARPQSTQVMSPHLLQALQNNVNQTIEGGENARNVTPTADNLRIEKTLKLRKGRYRRSNKVHGYENMVTEFKFN